MEEEEEEEGAKVKFPTDASFCGKANKSSRKEKREGGKNRVSGNNGRAFQVPETNGEECRKEAEPIGYRGGRVQTYFLLSLRYLFPRKGENRERERE